MVVFAIIVALYVAVILFLILLLAIVGAHEHHQWKLAQGQVKTPEQAREEWLADYERSWEGYR